MEKNKWKDEDQDIQRVILSVIDVEVKRIEQIKHLLPFFELERALNLPMCAKGE